MAWLHTWTGLVVGWVLFFVFVTGTAGYVDDEITRWMQPELPLAGAPAQADRDALLALGMARLQEVAPGARQWQVTLPHQSLRVREHKGLEISWEDMPAQAHDRGRRGSEKLDPRTGQPRHEPEARDTGGGRSLYVMHYALHYMPYKTAILLVGACTMLMLLAVVTGVITHKKIFKDFFTFRPGKGQRSWLDAHNVLSVMSLPFFLMITYTGLLFFAFDYMPAARNAVFGSSPLAQQPMYDELYRRFRDPHLPMSAPAASVPDMIRRAQAQWGAGEVATVRMARPEGGAPIVELGRVPGRVLDAYEPELLRFHADNGDPLPPDPRGRSGARTTQTVLFSLHEGQFADWWLRWLYFISGLMGCGVIGTGLVLWTVKRRGRHNGRQASRFDAQGLKLVEALNVGTLLGLPLGVAVYFWANRLLPLGMAERAAWEIHALFLAWGWALLYGSVRPIKRAWLELAWLTAAAYALVPVLNALTTDRHLGVTLAHGDWGLAGFDLTMLGLGAAFAWMAHKIRRRWLARPAAAPAGRGPARAPDAAVQAIP
ncbi:PepSY-associated TM helix domain-containing protein [Orrella sp. JC864]|uniref:PepSY-associated TM helix domain-containing protein n=1 Tax=Orrella sp. JC864 TaxID=3120298 RepID=UPI003008F688